MINYRLNKLKILSFINRTIYKKRYILDNSKVIDLKKISKGDFNYDIVMIDKENNKESFRVFINIIFRKKIITYQLLKDFYDQTETNIYFNYLLNFIANSENKHILNKCYEC